jgi:hypothetical protein
MIWIIANYLLLLTQDSHINYQTFMELSDFKYDRIVLQPLFERIFTLSIVKILMSLVFK